jgi:hypothetical protein
VAGNAIEPPDRLGVRGAAETAPVLECFGERFRHEVARDLDIEGPAREICEQCGGLGAIHLTERRWFASCTDQACAESLVHLIR